MRFRQPAGVALLAVGMLAGCDMLGAAAKSSFTDERARVEQVLTTETDGYRFVAYVVTWNTVHVVVSDPLARSHYRQGDEIHFLAQRIEVPGGGKTLNFTLLE